MTCLKYTTQRESEYYNFYFLAFNFFFYINLTNTNKILNKPTEYLVTPLATLYFKINFELK